MVDAGPAPPTKQPPAGFRKTVSINPGAPPAAEEKPEKTEPEKPAQQRLPFSQDNLEKVWHEFRLSVRQTSMNYYTLLGHPWKLDGHQLTLEVSTQLQRDDFMALSPDLLGFLRQRMEDPGVRLEVEMVAMEHQRKAYTDREKLEAWLDERPDLKEWVDKLGLDPEF